MLEVKVSGTVFRFFDHLYAVSRNGEVLRKLEPFSPTKRPDGYMQVGRGRLLHRLVATCWLERPEGALHVHHINHNKQDNRASNLEWVSPKEHIADRHKGISNGHSMGEAGRAKLRMLRLGSKASEETKQKQREATLKLGLKPPPRPIGHKVSQEAIQRMRENSPNAAACRINGIDYASFSAAGRALGAKPHTLRKRCLSENFPDYKLLKSARKG